MVSHFLLNDELCERHLLNRANQGKGLIPFFVFAVNFAVFKLLPYMTGDFIEKSV